MALPSVAKDLDLTGEGISPAANMGTLALAATVIAVGALADRIGVRRVIVGGLILEIVGNLTVSASPNLELLLLGRGIAGVGMGALLAGASSMVPAIAGKK
ncbi:MAG: MFS transporter [Candidatus Nanopelagicales bacterium]